MSSVKQVVPDLPQQAGGATRVRELTWGKHVQGPGCMVQQVCWARQGGIDAGTQDSRLDDQLLHYMFSFRDCCNKVECQSHTCFSFKDWCYLLYLWCVCVFEMCMYSVILQFLLSSGHPRWWRRWPNCQESPVFFMLTGIVVMNGVIVNCCNEWCNSNTCV